MATKLKHEAEPELPEPEDDDDDEASDSSGEESNDGEGDQVDTAADATPESLKNLLEPLGKDQLIQILEAVLKDPALIARITAAAESDPAYRKLFVHGLSYETTSAAFAPFGEIEDGPLGYDRATKKLREFAIFVYKTVEGCQKAPEEPNKVFEWCMLQRQRALEGLKAAFNRSFSSVIKDLKYGDTHEWVKVDGTSDTIGITDHAHDHLSYVVYVKLPEVGATISQGKNFGAVESMKAQFQAPAVAALQMQATIQPNDLAMVVRNRTPRSRSSSSTRTSSEPYGQSSGERPSRYLGKCEHCGISGLSK